ncbi:MAG: aldose 1-epimerase family protein [Lachnospiraceae bacterium]|nr:aldose 1-epimerase family protein [Lachnospiraceae bacterium]
MENYVLKNEFIKVEVSAHGAELRSIQDVDNGREYLWQADKRFWARTSPVLFPVVGAFKDGRYTHKGKTYEMGQHGFARDMDFTLESQTEDEIFFVLTDNEETLKKYPFHFKLVVGYELLENTVNVIWRVENTGDEDMFFSIGAHPAFRCSLGIDRMVFDTVNPLTSGILENGVLTDRTKTIETEKGNLILHAELFDEDALVIENNQTQSILLEDEEGKRFVDVDFSSPLVGIWSPPKKNAPFVCIEPWYGRADRADFEGELKDREYSNNLAPDGKFEANYQITVYQ